MVPGYTVNWELSRKERMVALTRDAHQEYPEGRESLPGSQSNSPGFPTTPILLLQLRR